MCSIPKNYPEIKKKLLIYNIFSLIILFVLLSNIQDGIIHTLFPFNGKVEFIGIKFQLSFLIPIIAIPLILNILELQRIFSYIKTPVEVEYILKPLANAVNFNLSKDNIKYLEKPDNRKSLINNVFYAYTDPENPKISEYASNRVFGDLFGILFCLENAAFYFTALVFLFIMNWFTFTYYAIAVFSLLLLSGFLYFFKVKFKETNEIQIADILNEKYWDKNNGEIIENRKEDIIKKFSDFFKG